MNLECGRCGQTSQTITVNGVPTDPPGWAVVTLTGSPIVNRTLCVSCSKTVRRAVLHRIGTE